MGTLANPSNVSNQMFLSYALVEWSVVAYLAADAYVFVHIKLGSWPPSLYHDRLSHEARQVPTRAAAQPSLVVRRPLAVGFSGSPPWRTHRRAQSRRAEVDVCVGDGVGELVARGHAWLLQIRRLTHGAVAPTSTTRQILHSWSGTVCHESYIEHSVNNRQN